MIDGLRFKVTGHELRDRLRSLAEKQLGRINGVLAQTEKEKALRQAMAANYQLLADHVHDGDYSLTVPELNALEMVVTLQDLEADTPSVARIIH